MVATVDDANVEGSVAVVKLLVVVAMVTFGAALPVQAYEIHRHLSRSQQQVVVGVGHPSICHWTFHRRSFGPSETATISETTNKHISVIQSI
jgi:hypothetical protein